jgi:quercetin dioxygenase-like cupin family protein
LDAHDQASKPGDPAYFTGAVTLRPLAGTEAPANVKLIRVEFPAGARTHWHTHSGVQVLFIAAGRCRFQHAGGPVEEAGTGETIWIPAGEKHWHGAAPGAPMAHVAVNIDFETEWLEPVTDEQYLA